MSRIDDYFMELIRDMNRMNTGKVTLYVNNEQEVKDLRAAALGFYEVRRISPDKTPQVLRSRIGLELIPLEASGAW